MDKFQEWILRKNPLFFLFEENGDRLIAFSFSGPGYISDGWVIKKDDLLTANFFASDDEFQSTVENFLREVPNFEPNEVGSCTYSLDDEQQECAVVNFLKRKGFKQSDPAWELN